MTTRREPGRIQQLMQNEQRMQIIKDEKVVASLLPEKSPTRRQYPESEFRQNFLPVLTGDAYTNLPEGYSPQQVADEATSCWLMIAGGPNAEVDVVNPDGSVAFVVPALMDTSRLNIAQPKDDPGLRKLTNDVFQKVQGLPDVAKRELARGLDRKLTYLASAGTGDRKVINERISAIRSFYGLPDAGSVNTTQASNGQPNGGFMGEMSFD